MNNNYITIEYGKTTWELFKDYMFNKYIVALYSSKDNTWSYVLGSDNKEHAFHMIEYGLENNIIVSIFDIKNVRYKYNEKLF